MTHRKRIPEEVFILVYPHPDNGYTPFSSSPFYDRATAELAARKLGRGMEVVGYHLVRTVELG